MSFPEGFEDRFNSAMAAIGFQNVPHTPRNINGQWILEPYSNQPHVFCREYDNAGFKYQALVTLNDIARHGEEAVIAMNVRTAQRP